MENLYINDCVFFLIENGKILAWNYDLNEQYLLESEYFLTLLEISSKSWNNKIANKKIISELLEGNLISKDRAITSNWGWDVLSKIFHVGDDVLVQNLNRFSLREFADSGAFIRGCVRISQQDQDKEESR